MAGDGRSQGPGTLGTEAEANVQFSVIDSTQKVVPVTDEDELLLSKMVGTDSNGDFQRLAVDQAGRLKVKDVQFDGSVDIGDLQILDDQQQIIDPATEGTLSSIEANTNGLFEPSDFTEARNVRELQNETSVIAGAVTDDTTGSSLPSNGIPDGRTVRVQADPGNSASLLVSGSFSLQPGQGLDLGVDDTSKISFTAQSSGDELEFIVES